jgi:hypothetical protein
LFAEKVLGCKFRYDWTTGNMDLAGGLIDGHVAMKPLDECEPGCGCSPDAPHSANRWDRYESASIAFYTRSLDAAWAGVAKLGWEVEFSRLGFETKDGPDRWKCCLRVDDSENHHVDGWFHPAEAFVLACLRAVGVAEEELV